ncbi:MAG: hypothetical protein HY647_09055 [Acidobacteria bacterium]|nr:hypothetical protein [Acidobacteriota bacterium]
MINRAMHDIWYEEANDEIFIANPFAQAILVFRGGVDGEEPPIRILQGPRTQLTFPDYGVVVDPVHNELFVVEKEYILVFPRTANGDVAPLRVIRGADTRLRDTRGLAVDTTRNLLVAGVQDGLAIFNRTDNGNVKPRAVIGGPQTGIRSTIQNLRIYEPKGWIVGILSGFGRSEEEESGGGRSRSGGAIAVWSVNDNGDVPPLWLLSDPAGSIGGMRVALNPKHKEVIVGGGVVVKTYAFPEIF